MSFENAAIPVGETFVCTIYPTAIPSTMAMIMNVVSLFFFVMQALYSCAI